MSLHKIESLQEKNNHDSQKSSQLLKKRLVGKKNKLQEKIYKRKIKCKCLQEREKDHTLQL
jgi:hypothetical protein